MTKLNKKILIVLAIIIAAIILLQGKVNAENVFTTDDGIVVTKKSNSNFSGGNVELAITNIPIKEEMGYEWNVSRTTTIADDANWYLLADTNTTAKTANLILTTENGNILAMLRTTNTLYISVRDSEKNIIIDKLKIDVTLEPFSAFDLYYRFGNTYILGGTGCSVEQWNPSTYNISSAMYKFEKIEDEELINGYRTALKDKTNLGDVTEITVDKIKKIDGWISCTKDHSYPKNRIEEEKIPTDAGVYYLWIKAQDVDSKVVYGVKVINIDAEAPKVNEIRVVSPDEGTYKTEQTIKIRAEFTEVIAGDKMPTMKIKFAEGEVRELTNGTLVNTSNNNSYAWGHYIEYSYNIQASDVGQLALVSFEGGNIADTTGNKAVITCPVLTGNIIKANVEGQTNTNTDNQDKTEDKTTPDDTKKEETKQPTTPDDTKKEETKQPTTPDDIKKEETNKKDKTTISSKLPYTGSATITGLVIASIVLIVIGYKKVKTMDDIK